MPIETDFDVPFIAGLALREKQIQQNYRPIIAVHKWFARRPGTLFRGLILSEFGERPLTEAFYQPNSFTGVRVADPFMGGGTPLLEANRLGCDVTGFDVNPMAYWIVKQEIEHLSLVAYQKEADRLVSKLRADVGALYETECLTCGAVVPVKYFLWVKTIGCDNCDAEVSLFPGYLLAKDIRHPKCVYVCQHCGALNEIDGGKPLGKCDTCGDALQATGLAYRNRATCKQCGAQVRYPQSQAGPPRHRLFAMEYHCPHCKPNHKGRFFKAPGEADIAKVREAEDRAARSRFRFVPQDEIPEGDETNRLHRWGYRRFREMFCARQLLGMELSCRAIAKVKDERVRNALATNLSDLLRYQNMLCRYDTMALKSLDVFSVHGFPVGLIQCESNLLGIMGPSGGGIGSGGWANIVTKFAKATAYCEAPFEIAHKGTKKQIIPIPGEWIGDRPNGNGTAVAREVDIRCVDAAAEDIPENSLDAVFTDPPYFGNVQYAELMDFCYIWLRSLIDGADGAFEKASTITPEELTGNATQRRGLEAFADGLSKVFQKMAVALKPGKPLAFTYHHNELTAYAPIVVAILDSGLQCTAAIPCPAEMHGSIHISGTKSSIVDTVFVCRDVAIAPQADNRFVDAVRCDLAALAEGGREATEGDALCIINGRLARDTITQLSGTWDKNAAIVDKLARAVECMDTMPKPKDILAEALATPLPETKPKKEPMLF